ncbi:MAG: Ribosomal protein [Candidatus Saccharibacteria bacterium]|nr:Ribosomal protein [Candidatus Saccharibacteria bacterium]
MVEHFHGKEGVQGSIPCLGSSYYQLKRNRPFITLRSEEDPTMVYTTSKNPKNTTDRIVARKYSKLLRKVVEFKESK